MDLYAGQTVLDVASGNGNVSLAAARRFCKVVSTDYVPELLEQSKRRAAADGLTIDYRETDAEDLPFADATFDNVVFSKFYGPMLKAFEALDDKSGASLRGDILQLIATHNRAAKGPMVVPSDYLEVAIVR